MKYPLDISLLFIIIIAPTYFNSIHKTDRFIYFSDMATFFGFHLQWFEMYVKMDTLNKILISGEKDSAFFYAGIYCVCFFLNNFYSTKQTKNSLLAFLRVCLDFKIALKRKHPMILFSSN